MSKAISKDSPRRGASHKAYWRDLIAKNLDGYREVLQWDPFKEWSKWQRPHRTVEGQLDNGLELLCGDAPRVLADDYFRKGCLIGQRLMTEKGWRRRKWCAFDLPANLGLIRRAMAYCQMFLGKPLDPNAARQSTSEITQFYADQDGDGWSEFDQQDFIGVVVFLLVAKQFDDAARVIRLG